MSSESVGNKWLCCSVLLVLLCQLTPELLQYDRQSPQEFWRFYISHFVHWDFNHLCWDLLLFITLSSLLIKEEPKIFISNLLLCPWIISAIMWAIEPEMLYYRGISGIDAALFSSLAVLWIKKGQTVFCIVGVLQLVLISAKVIYELKTDQALFTNSESYIVMPWAHLAGAVIGCLIALFKVRNLDSSQAVIIAE